MTLTAVPSAGYVFSGWSGHTDGISNLNQNPVTFQMGDRTDNNRVMTATFAPSDLRYRVTAISEPSGGGSVSLYPTQPADGYPVNQSVSVSAVAESGYVFNRWTGDLAGFENVRSLLVNEDSSFAAIFYPGVTVYCSPTEGGSVLINPTGSNGYAVGTEVTVTAEANKGYRFVSWEGGASGSASSVRVTVDAPKTITARFGEQSHSRWWLWALMGLVGLSGTLILLRVVYVRMTWGRPDELPWQE